MFDSNKFLLSTWIAVVLFIVLAPYPGVAFVIVTPIIFAMVFKPCPEYFLALIIYMGFGSQHRIVACFSFFVYSILNFNRIQRYGLGKLFSFYLLLLPVFLWVFFKRWGVVALDTTAQFQTELSVYSGSAFALREYCAPAAFFWAVVAIKRLDHAVFKGLSWLIFGILAFAVIAMVGIETYDTGQYVFWSLAYAAALLAWRLFVPSAHKTYQILLLISFFIAFILTFFIGAMKVSFTQFGLAAFSFGMMVTGLRFRKLWFLWLPVAWMLSSTIYVCGSEARVEKYQGHYVGSVSYDKLTMTSLSGMIERIQRKAFDDRAVVWAAALRDIRTNLKKGLFYVNPQIKPLEMRYYNAHGQETCITTYMPAHNLFLQLTKAYGIFGICLYLVILAIPMQKYLFPSLLAVVCTPYAPMIVASLVFVSFASISAGAVLNPQIALLVFGTLGAGYRYIFDTVRQMRKERWVR